MSISNFPTYDNNTFGINSLNQFNLNIMNPYSLYYYTVTIVTPVIPAGQESVVVAPTVLFQDFLDWCGTYVDVDNENHALYRLAVLLLDVAKDYIDVDFIGLKSYKRAVCLYAGHYLEMHIKMLKDEAVETSANPEQKDKVIKMDIPLDSKAVFKQTISGRLFWDIYGGIARLSGFGVNSMWGGF